MKEDLKREIENTFERLVKEGVARIHKEVARNDSVL